MDTETLLHGVPCRVVRLRARGFRNMCSLKSPASTQAQIRLATLGTLAAAAMLHLANGPASISCQDVPKLQKEHGAKSWAVLPKLRDDPSRQSSTHPEFSRGGETK